jgi:2-methylcitrate dehydratase PrpD
MRRSCPIMENKDLALVIAKNVVNLKYEDIPGEVTEVTKRCILDILGTTMAGSTEGQGCKQIVDLVKEWGGKEESTVLGFGVKAPCWMAAFANGAMCHALDYDDAFDTGFLHATITTVPPAFAIAERVGKVTGKEFITAITSGNDLITRLGLALNKHPGGYGRDWSPTSVFGRFSAAAACGRLLRLDQNQMADALGIAFTQVAGTLQTSFGPGAMIRGLYASFVGQQGVMAALLAQKGITGCKAPFEGKAGLFNVYFDGKYNEDLLIGELGKRFEGVNVAFKPWPSCRVSHAYIEATLSLVQKHHIHADDIEEIKVYVGDLAQPLCEPIERRRKPEMVSEAKFSIPFIVASAIVRGSPVIAHFTAEGFKDAATLRLAQKVTAQFAPELDKRDCMPPALIEMKNRAGRVYSEKVEIAYGNPQKPIRVEDLTAKFRDCLLYSAKPISKENQEKLISMVLRLEDVDDVSQIINLLS